MAFSVDDVRDLLKLLDEHPDWKREVRRAILTDEILELPVLVRDLVEAQRRTEARLEALTARVDALAEAQRRTEARLEALTARVDALAEAQRRTEVRLQELAKVQRRLVNDVAALKGDNLERKFRERFRQYVRRPYRGARLFSLEDLGDLLDEGVDQGRITEADADEALLVDAVVRASDMDGEVFLAVEVSSVVDRHDVERAARRARILEKLGKRARAAVAGLRVTEGAEEALASLHVAWFKMGDDEPAWN